MDRFAVSLKRTDCLWFIISGVRLGARLHFFYKGSLSTQAALGGWGVAEENPPLMSICSNVPE
jgi:hypothetical protein